MTQYPTAESRRFGRDLILLLVAAATAVAVACLISDAATGAELLKTAGLTASNGAISGVANFVNSIKGNIIWLAATAVGLMAAVVGFLFMSGHSRAQDYAIKGIAGLLIIVAVPGIVT